MTLLILFQAWHYWLVILFQSWHYWFYSSHDIADFIPIMTLLILFQSWHYWFYSSDNITDFIPVMTLLILFHSWHYWFYSSHGGTKFIPIMKLLILFQSWCYWLYSSHDVTDLYVQSCTALNLYVHVYFFISFFCFRGRFPSLPWDFFYIIHNDPAAHQDHCRRCRIPTRDLGLRSLVR